MGKRSRKTRPSSNPKTKFIIIGVIGAIVAAGIYAASLDPDSIKAPDPNSSKLSLDTRQGSPVLGDPSAPVTIVEFGDYQCPFCKRWNENTKPAIEQNLIQPGKASLVYVDFPIIGPDSVTIHAGSYCAADQGLYWRYHDFAYTNQGHENDGWASAENLKSLVSKLNGIDSDLFNECLDSKKYEKRVNDNRKIASDAGATSTPSFIIISPDGSGETIIGAQPYGAFKAVVDQMLS